MTGNYLCETIRDRGYVLVSIGRGHKLHIARPVVDRKGGFVNHTHAMCGKGGEYEDYPNKVADEGICGTCRRRFTAMCEFREAIGSTT